MEEIKSPNYITSYPKYLKDHEVYLSLHNLESDRSLSYKIIIDNSKFIIGNEKLVLNLINESIDVRSL